MYFFVPRYAWMNTKFTTLQCRFYDKNEQELILFTESLMNFRIQKFTYKRF